MPNRSSSTVRVSYPAYSRAELIDLLRKRMAGLAVQLPLERAVLFGSWACERATAYSDIDLLVVYTGPAREDAYALGWRGLRLRGVEPHVYSAAEAERLQPTLERMARGGISLL
jgi:hypothetical protein